MDITKHSPLFKQIELKLFGHGTNEEAWTFSITGTLEVFKVAVVVVFIGVVEVVVKVVVFVVVVVVVVEIKDVNILLLVVFISLLVFLILQNGPLFEKSIKITRIS